jgi:hypothetical protein
MTARRPQPAIPFTTMERVSRYLETHPASTGDAVRRAVTGGTEAKVRALDLLIAEGYATGEAGKHGARRCTSVRPYRVADDPRASAAPDPDKGSPRAGKLTRIVRGREVLSRCADCGLVMTETTSAASHARSARHVVTVDYSSTFAYVPTERLGWSTLEAGGG